MRLGFGCVNLGTVSGGRTLARRRPPRPRGRRPRRARVRHRRRVRQRRERADHRSGARPAPRRVELATKGGYLFRERSRLERRGRRWREAVRAAASADRAPPVGAGDRCHGATRSAGRHARPPADRPRGVACAVCRTDHVDVYQLHGPRQRPARAPRRAAGPRDAAARSGASASAPSRRTRRRRGRSVPAIDVVQMPVGVLDPEAVDVVADVGAPGVEVWARGVFGGGVLTAGRRGPGGRARDPKWPMIDRAARRRRSATASTRSRWRWGSSRRSRPCRRSCSA